MAVVDNRFRNGVFLVYPDSCKPDWIDLLRNEHVPFIVSPLHDKDVNLGELDGDLHELPKKAHFHVLICCDGNKPLSYFQSLSDLTARNGNGVKAWKCQNLRSMLRYFVHLDNPEKYQYPLDELRAFSGADLSGLWELQGEELYRETWNIVRYIAQKKITSLQSLIHNVMSDGCIQWFQIITSQRSTFFANYMKDIHFNEKEKKEKKSNV